MTIPDAGTLRTTAANHARQRPPYLNAGPDETGIEHLGWRGQTALELADPRIAHGPQRPEPVTPGCDQPTDVRRGSAR